MKEQKILKKLFSRAEIAKEILVDQKQITIIEDLKEFYKTKGDLFFCVSENAFYKNHKDSWVSYLNNPKQKEATQEVKISNGNFMEAEKIKKMYNDFLEWCKGLKIYVDENNEALKKDIKDLKIIAKKLIEDQEEFFKITKENIDLKLGNIKEVKKVKKVKKK